MPALAAIVLAAGSSSRLGQPKQLLHFQGQSLLTRAVSAARDAGCARVIVVVGANAEAILAELRSQPVEIARNERWPSGIGSSIRAGVGQLLNGDPVDGVFLMLCDQPHVSAETLRRLAAAQAQSGRPVAAAAYQATLGPPVLVTGAFIDALQTVADDQGAKSIWKRHADSVQVVSCEEAGLDIDLPSDLRLLDPAVPAAG